MRLLQSRKAQIAAIAIMLVLALVFLIQTYGKANRPQGFDLSSYLMSAKALMHGEDPYATGSPFPYLYPPFLAFSLIPLAVLPYWLAVFLWYLAAILSLILVARFLIPILGEGVGVGWHSGVYVPLTALCVLLGPMLQNNLLNGQVNFIVLALCVLFLKLHLDRRHNLSAVVLAAAISVKLVPAIFLLFLLVRRRYSAALLACVFAVGFCLVPALFMGDQATSIYSGWIESMTSLASSDGPEKGTMFFTLGGFLPYVLPGLSGLVMIKVVSALVVIAVIAGLDIYSQSRSPKSNEVWVFSAYLLATLLVLPISETHHLALLIPASLLILLRSTPASGISNIKRYAMPGVFFLLFWIGKTDKDGPWYFLAIVFLLACVGGQVITHRAASVESREVA